MLSIGLFGLVGNILSIIILSSKEMRSPFNRLLVALAVFDSVFISFMLLDYTFVRVYKWPFALDSELYAYLFPKLLFPLNNVSLCCSIYLIVCIAFERFSAVCRPFSYREAARPENVNLRVFKYIFFVTVFSSLINITRFFLTKFVTRHFNISMGNNSFHSGSRLTFDVT